MTMARHRWAIPSLHDHGNRPAGGCLPAGSSGLLVMEAEHFDLNEGGNGVPPWSVISDGNASNAEAIKAPLGLFTRLTGYLTGRISGDLLVDSGTHYVWIRYRAFGSGSDSLFLELDDLGPQPLHSLTVDGTWQWQQTFSNDAAVAGRPHDKAVSQGAEPGNRQDRAHIGRQLCPVRTGTSRECTCSALRSSGLDTRPSNSTCLAPPTANSGCQRRYRE